MLKDSEEEADEEAARQQLPSPVAKPKSKGGGASAQRQRQRGRAALPRASRTARRKRTSGSDARAGVDELELEQR